MVSLHWKDGTKKEKKERKMFREKKFSFVKFFVRKKKREKGEKEKKIRKKGKEEENKKETK